MVLKELLSPEIFGQEGTVIVGNGPERVKIAFLDVKKAFDLVSHQSLILATKRMGIPPPMFVYLQELYGDASTSIRIGPDRSELIGV